MTNPKGWYTLPVEVVTNGTFLMLVAEPPSEEDDPRGEIHHCDSMGCRRSHVLVSKLLRDYEIAALSHLIREAKAEQEAAVPAPSLREQVIARKGLVKPDTTLEQIAAMCDGEA